MAEDIFDQAAKTSGDIFDKAASASTGTNLKTGEGMQEQALQQSSQALGKALQGATAPYEQQQAELQKRKNRAMQMQNNSITPITNASALYAPVAAARAIIGAKAGGKIGSHFGPYGEVAGGLVGGALAGGAPTENPLNPVVNPATGGAQLSTWGEILSHPTKIPEAVLKKVVANRPVGPSGLSMAEREALELKAQVLTKRGVQQAILDRQAARNAPAPTQPSPFAGMTSTAGGAPPVAAAPTMPQGTPTPFVNKFTPPEPSRIVTPDSPPPAVKVTYQSYPRDALYQMAKQGDIEAGLELIRNPKGFSLPPNFRFLIEESAKKIPWRNLSK